MFANIVVRMLKDAQVCFGFRKTIRYPDRRTLSFGEVVPIVSGTTPMNPNLKTGEADLVQRNRCQVFVSIWLGLGYRN